MVCFVAKDKRKQEQNELIPDREAPNCMRPVSISKFSMMWHCYV